MIITIGKQQYEQTGITPCGKRVLCKLGDFERACRSLGNELLFVEVSEGEVVPRCQFKPSEGMAET